MGARKTTVIGVILVGMLGLSACGSDTTREYLPENIGSDSIAEYAPSQPAEDRSTQFESQVITTGSATVRAQEPADAADKFMVQVREEGGRIASSETSMRDEEPRASVTARVPAEKYQTVVDALDDYGEVLAHSTQATDVGQEKVDLEARSQALRASIDRLTGLMGSAESVEDLLAAEEMMTQRQSELDSLTGQLDYLNDQVSMSTLSVTFTPDVETYRSPNVFQRAWDAFTSSLEATLIVFMGLLPWLLILGAVAAVVWALIRRRRRRGPDTTA